MSEFKYPFWMNVFPSGLAVAIGLIGCVMAKKLIVIIGMPIGILIGFGIIHFLTKKSN